MAAKNVNAAANYLENTKPFQVLASPLCSGISKEVSTELYWLKSVSQFIDVIYSDV